MERWKKRHADDKRAAAKAVGDLEARAQALQDQLAEGHAQVRPRRPAKGPLVPRVSLRRSSTHLPTHRVVHACWMCR